MILKSWKVDNFSIKEIECEELDIHNRNTFATKEDAIKTAMDIVNQRITKNLDYLEKIRQELNEQEKIVEYYVTKRNKLIIEAKVENIKIDDVIL